MLSLLTCELCDLWRSEHRRQRISQFSRCYQTCWQMRNFLGLAIWRKRVFDKKVMDSFKKVTGRWKYKTVHIIVLFMNEVNPKMPKFENLVIITTCQRSPLDLLWTNQTLPLIQPPSHNCHKSPKNFWILSVYKNAHTVIPIVKEGKIIPWERRCQAHILKAGSCIWPITHFAILTLSSFF